MSTPPGQQPSSKYTSSPYLSMFSPHGRFGLNNGNSPGHGKTPHTIRAEASQGFFLPRMGKTPRRNFKLMFRLVVCAVPSVAELVRTWITWHFPCGSISGHRLSPSAPMASQGPVLGKGDGSFHQGLPGKEGRPAGSFIWKLQLQNPSCVSQLGLFCWRREGPSKRPLQPLSICRRPV